MGAELTQGTRIELFKAYCERRSIQHVARVCSVSPTTALRYKRLDNWDGRLVGITQKADEKIDDSIVEVMARQAKQARAVQAKALQRIVEDGFKTSRAAADAYFRAAQEERVIRGEPSDRLDIVQCRSRWPRAGRTMKGLRSYWRMRSSGRSLAGCLRLKRGLTASANLRLG